eukprot:scaffold1570_cov202-Prasinococcus_capsulatus_cf.AAC.1
MIVVVFFAARLPQRQRRRALLAPRQRRAEGRGRRALLLDGQHQHQHHHHHDDAADADAGQTSETAPPSGRHMIYNMHAHRRGARAVRVRVGRALEARGRAQQQIWICCPCAPPPAEGPRAGG